MDMAAFANHIKSIDVDFTTNKLTLSVWDAEKTKYLRIEADITSFKVLSQRKKKNAEDSDV